jgi:hypothetical protein
MAAKTKSANESGGAIVTLGLIIGFVAMLIAYWNFAVQGPPFLQAVWIILSGTGDSQ